MSNTSSACAKAGLERPCGPQQSFRLHLKDGHAASLRQVIFMVKPPRIGVAITRRWNGMR